MRENKIASVPPLDPPILKTVLVKGDDGGFTKLAAHFYDYGYYEHVQQLEVAAVRAADVSPPTSRGEVMPRRVLIPLSLEEFHAIIDALDDQSASAELAMNVAYHCLTKYGRRKLDDKRVNPRMLRGELFTRLQKAEKEKTNG